MLFTTKPENPRTATIDHIVPLSKGGTNLLVNLRLAHRACNNERGNRSEEETLEANISVRRGRRLALDLE
jgi:5-methylcytosine-specific restriction endonuclease McrA